MDRINHASAEADKFGAGKDGFTDGDPTDPSSGTVVNEDFLDGVQEELVGLIEAAGDTPTNADYTQLADAILNKVGGQYLADNVPIKFTNFSDAAALAYITEAPANERMLLMAFGVPTARINVYFSGTGIEFAYNVTWSTGVGWVSTGGTSESLMTLQPAGPILRFEKTLVSNAFTDRFTITGDHDFLPSTDVGNTLYGPAVTKVMGRVSSNGGSDNTPVVATGSLGIKTPVSGKVTSVTVVIDFDVPFANTNYIPTLTSASNTDAYAFTVVTRTTSLMSVEIDKLSDGTPVNPLTTPVAFFVDIKGAQ